jgi:heme exporter protein C
VAGPETKKGWLGLSEDAWTYGALAVGTVLTLVDFFLAFLVAPLVLGAGVGETAIIGDVAVSNKLLFSQKIFYYHVPVAISSFLIVFVAGYYSIRFLGSREKVYDTKARIAVEVALIFTTLTMITGDLWTRFEWGAWWVWEPRLTTYFIMTLLIIAYFVLRNSIEDEERRAVYAAVWGILIPIDAAVSFLITRLIPSSVHPVVLRSGGGLLPTQLAPFLIGLFGMMMIAWVVFRLRMRQELAKERIDALKAAVEG